MGYIMCVRVELDTVTLCALVFYTSVGERWGRKVTSWNTASSAEGMESQQSLIPLNSRPASHLDPGHAWMWTRLHAGMQIPTQQSGTLKSIYCTRL